jgi:hypothetical protein
MEHCATVVFDICNAISFSTAVFFVQFYHATFHYRKRLSYFRHREFAMSNGSFVETPGLRPDKDHRDVLAYAQGRT